MGRPTLTCSVGCVSTSALVRRGVCVGVQLPGVVGGGPAGDLGDDVVHVDATELLVCNNVNDVLTHGDNLATMITML